MAEVGYWVLAALALIGLFALFRRPAERRGPWVIWLVPVLMVLAASWLISSTRYAVPAYPFMVFLSAIAVVDLIEPFLRARLGSRAFKPSEPGNTG